MPCGEGALGGNWHLGGQLKALWGAAMEAAGTVRLLSVRLQSVCFSHSPKACSLAASCLSNLPMAGQVTSLSWDLLLQPDICFGSSISFFWPKQASFPRQCRAHVTLLTACFIPGHPYLLGHFRLSWSFGLYRMLLFAVLKRTCYPNMLDCGAWLWQHPRRRNVSTSNACLLPRPQSDSYCWYIACSLSSFQRELSKG